MHICIFKELWREKQICLLVLAFTEYIEVENSQVTVMSY